MCRTGRRGGDRVAEEARRQLEREVLQECASLSRSAPVLTRTDERLARARHVGGVEGFDPRPDQDHLRGTRHGEHEPRRVRTQDPLHADHSHRAGRARQVSVRHGRGHLQVARVRLARGDHLDVRDRGALAAELHVDADVRVSSGLRHLRVARSRRVPRDIEPRDVDRLFRGQPGARPEGESEHDAQNK